MLGPVVSSQLFLGILDSQVSMGCGRLLLRDFGDASINDFVA
jgi:hypothetical protein